MAAATFKNPYAALEIIDGINDYLNENKIKSVSEIIGTVQPW